MGFFKGLVEGLLGKQPSPPAAARNQPELETFEAGGITFSVGMVPPTPEQEAAWEKKRQATALIRSGDTTGAVKALEEAQSLEGDPQSHDEIRRAKYLQKDERSAEAWAIYVRLLDESDSAWIDVDVLDAMRLHLQREDQAERAIDFGIAHRVARINLYREMKREAEEALNGPMPESMKAFSRGSDLWERQREHHRSTVEFSGKWIADLTDPTDLADTMTTLAKKAKLQERIPALVEAITVAIETGRSARDCLPPQVEVH